LGLGGHHDIGGDHDFGGHDAGGHDASGHDTGHDADHSHEGGSGTTNWFLSVLTFRTLSAAAAFFGLTGLVLTKAGIEQEIAVAAAIAVALAVAFTIRWLMQNLSRLNLDGTVHIHKAIGAAGTVYLSIPGNQAGAGKVHVRVDGRLIEYKAITKSAELPTGADVVVVAVIDSGTLEVTDKRNSHE
jgi:membrane protein implicated in regulation of membrane protease activity